MRGDINKEQGDELKATDEAVSVERQQELLLINKLAASGKLPPKSQGNFLQKKLQQRKFFDSGDYAMNQNKEKKTLPPAFQQQQQQAPQVPVLATPMIEVQTQEQKSPTTEIDPQLRQCPLLATVTSSGCSVDAGDSDDEGSQLQIPRPDTVPQRKASILHPSVHSKLSPQPHIHHDYNDESITAPPE